MIPLPPPHLAHLADVSRIPPPPPHLVDPVHWTNPASPHFDPPSIGIGRIPPPPPHLAHLADVSRIPPPPGRDLAADIAAMFWPGGVMPAPAPAEKPTETADVECYKNYFLVKFMTYPGRQVTAEYEMFLWQGQLLVTFERAHLEAHLRRVRLVTFNGNGYDVPMIAAALQGFDCAQLKWLSDQIIVRGLRPWEIEREYKIAAPEWLDHIDLIEVMPGQYGLKAYMGKMHSKKIQDLPINPAAEITPEQRVQLRTYCGNDLEGNCDAFAKFEKEFALRERMSKQYGLDLRSKSDAQIAEAVIKHELGFKVERPEWVVGSWFNYDPPPFIRYQTATLQRLLEMVRSARFVLGPSGVEMPPELGDAKITVGYSTYTLGIGGLHSNESKTFHLADEHVSLRDVDVASYYPTLMLNSGQYPPQMGPAFLQVFKAIVDQRLAAKAAGDKSTADSLKITINGTFGKTLSKYGILSAPKLGIQTTVTGQLSLLMLVEALEACGIHVVSGNTDGIVIKCPRPLEWLRDDVVAWWEKETGLQTEANDYEALYSRDVNSYVAVKAKGREVKLKGAYAPSVPVGGSWPNPTGAVCVDAVVAYLLHRTPVEETIHACRDIRQFVHVRNVKGGGVKYYGDQVDAVTTLGAMRAQLAAAGWIESEPKLFYLPHGGPGVEPQTVPMKEAYKLALQQLRERDPVRKEYLGKVVRWYYGAGEPGAIRYATNGNLVATTEGAVPCMELPDRMPQNIDYAKYVRDAKSMISDLGVPII